MIETQTRGNILISETLNIFSLVSICVPSGFIIHDFPKKNTMKQKVNFPTMSCRPVVSNNSFVSSLIIHIVLLLQRQVCRYRFSILQIIIFSTFLPVIMEDFTADMDSPVVMHLDHNEFIDFEAYV